MTSPHALATRLADLLSREHAALADFLVALADFDRQRAWERLGHANLFSFLHRQLGLSKGAAHYRKVAAELVQRHPEIVEPLRDGRLCFSSVLELAKVITPENAGEVLPRFFHRSRREAMEVAAELRPAETVPLRDVVTAVRPRAADVRSLALAPAPAPGPAPLPRAREAGDASTPRCGPAAPRSGCAEAVAAEDAGRTVGVRGPLAPPPNEIPAQPLRPESGEVPHIAVHPDELRDAEPRAAPATVPAERDSVTPLTADLRRLRVTVSRRFLEKLEAARMALSHSHPGATTEQILDVALDLLLARDAKRKGLVAKPREERRPTKTKHIPAAVKREVWIRDEGRCQAKLASGGICGSKLRVQLDHVVPRTLGGPSTAANLRCLCASHNLAAAREVLGDDVMERYAPRRGRAASEHGSASP